MENFFSELFNLHRGEEDKHKTLENVKSNISFRGANLWILACAIIVASVGLNVNSSAVVIGAMLISPLMGPIVGAGFALGVYDFSLLRKSLKNLLIATVVSLIVATLFFYLSPFKEAQSELLARTSPNIYDILIAFFGGLVGVIAITRVEKGNPIPGVAIATALMPPLCTAGYGLATAHWTYFFGALFLYSINCVFICIATFSIVKYLKYPSIKQLDLKHQKQVKYGITALILLMLLPSAYFAYSLYLEQQFKQQANEFIEKEFIENGSTLVYKKIDYTNQSKTIVLAFLKKSYSDTDQVALNKKLNDFGLKNTKLVIKQNTSDNIQALKNDILNEVTKKDIIQNEKDKRIADLEKRLGEDTFNNKQLLSEMNVLFPNIKEVSLSKQHFQTLQNTRLAYVLCVVSKPNLEIREKEKLKNWLLKKLNINQLEIVTIEN